MVKFKTAIHSHNSKRNGLLKNLDKKSRPFKGIKVKDDMESCHVLQCQLTKGPLKIHG